MAKKKTKEKFNWRKFLEKGITRLAWRAVEIAILVVLAIAFGFRVPRMA